MASTRIDLFGKWIADGPPALVSVPPRLALPARLPPDRVMQNPGSLSTGRGATAFGAG